MKKQHDEKIKKALKKLESLANHAYDNAAKNFRHNLQVLDAFDYDDSDCDQYRSACERERYENRELFI